MNNTYYIVAVHDKKAKVFDTPFAVPNMTVALRAFQNICEDEKSMLYKYPEDFEMCLMATIDNEDGDTVAQGKQVIAQATEYKKSHNADIPSATDKKE